MLVPANAAFADLTASQLGTASGAPSRAFRPAWRSYCQDRSRFCAFIILALFAASDTGKPGGDNIDPWLVPGERARLSWFASARQAATVPDGNGNTVFGSNSISGFVLDQNFYDLNCASAERKQTRFLLAARRRLTGLRSPRCQQRYRRMWVRIGQRRHCPVISAASCYPLTVGSGKLRPTPSPEPQAFPRMQPSTISRPLSTDETRSKQTPFYCISARRLAARGSTASLSITAPFPRSRASSPPRRSTELISS